MLCYLAPMEGITTYIYRNAHAKYFGGIDKYFTPFISDKNIITDKNFIPDNDVISGKIFIPEKSDANVHNHIYQKNKSINARELRDILPENNVGIPLVPQVLTNNAGRFLAVAGQAASYGYDAINLNLGCPSGTVTAKKRGSGFLSIPDKLDAFLYEIFEKCPLKISVKTRLGISDLKEWDRLLDIYTKYPIHELIIHTRLQQEFYTGTAHPEAYAAAVARIQTRFPLCYNGDIVSPESLEKISVRPDRIMIGRGIIQNPALAGHLRTDGQTSARSGQKIPDQDVWRAFHDEILDGYIQIMSGDSPTLFKMKELWTYMSRSFTNPDKYLKKIRKANRISEYVCAVDKLFREQEISG